MKILISNALIIDPLSAFNNKLCDIFIDDFEIKNIQLSKDSTINQNEKSFTRINASGMYLMPCFTDMRAHIPDPGFEFKEDFDSAAKTALAGGFSKLAVLPDTKPAIDNKSSVEYVIHSSNQSDITFLPLGSISNGLNGKDLSEMYDMHLAGAVAFTDADQSLQNAGLMLRALLYSKIFNGLIMIHAFDKSISENGMMHEGKMSVNLGMKGIPALAEETIIMRDLELAKYADTRIHFSHISTKGSVDLIRKAKKQNIQVTCDVAVANLCFTDEDLISFDTCFKTNPPLRSKNDKKALWDGLADGTIDCIITDHYPQHEEAKQVEFEYALPGMNTLQTTLNLLMSNKPQSFTMQQLVQVLCHAPNNILKQPENAINTGNRADMFLFDPNTNWILDDTTNYSKSKNSPLYLKSITGKTKFVIAKNKLHKL